MSGGSCVGTCPGTGLPFTMPRAQSVGRKRFLPAGATLLFALAVGFAIGGGFRLWHRRSGAESLPAATVPQRTPTPATAAMPAAPAETPVIALAANATEPKPERVEVARLAHEKLLQGRDRLADGELAAGLEAFEAAVQLDSNAETNGALGALYFMMAARTEAYTHLRRATDLDPDNPDRWLALANAEHLRIDPGAAWDAVRRARELDPELVIERDPSGFVFRADRGPESVYYDSPYLPRRNTP